MPTHSSFLALLTGLVLTSSSFAVGAALETQRMVRVHYADLDVSTGPGLRTLYARIQAAALRVCVPGTPDFRTLLTSDEELCLRDTVAAAVSRTRIPHLRALGCTRAGYPGCR